MTFDFHFNLWNLHNNPCYTDAIEVLINGNSIENNREIYLEMPGSKELHNKITESYYGNYYRIFNFDIDTKLLKLRNETHYRMLLPSL